MIFRAVHLIYLLFYRLIIIITDIGKWKIKLSEVSKMCHKTFPYNLVCKIHITKVVVVVVVVVDARYSYFLIFSTQHFLSHSTLKISLN